MYSKMTAVSESARELIRADYRLPKELDPRKKDRRVEAPLTEEQYQELLTMTGPSSTA